jgi:hypothetical protein
MLHCSYDPSDRTLRPAVTVILSSGYTEPETISLLQSKGLAGFI